MITIFRKSETRKASEENDRATGKEGRGNMAQAAEYLVTGVESSDTSQIIHHLLTENYSSYYMLAYRYVRNEQDALDVVQEGACKAIQKCSDIRNSRYAGTWLYRIMIHTAVDFIKKRKSEPEFTDLCRLQAGEPDHYENTDLIRAVNSMDSKAATIIRLYYYEDLTIAQVAQLVGEKESTVKSRLYRSLRRLRVIMES